ncbi:hypothetical protein [Streptomyces sp. NPDC050564]|jgi:hypothetical protein|uniref:hypothetical protein n=1 Tax=Streptomyces sp. NPDC050564 TaxID=3365631 RepID=UPI0037B409FC
MLLEPPGLIPPCLLPHWSYVRAVDDALTRCGIPPGTVRAGRTGREYGERMYIVLTWDVSRTGGVRLHWEEGTGWSYSVFGANPRIKLSRRPLTSLHRVFASPDDIADAAGRLAFHAKAAGLMPCPHVPPLWHIRLSFSSSPMS